MSVRREQLSGCSIVEFFICPLCKGIVRDMVFHDGGYDQPFCQRPFCTACLAKYQRVREKNMTGPLKKVKYSCPVAGCDRPLQSPMLRSPDPCDLELHKEIRISCDYCHAEYETYDYYDHLSTCFTKDEPSFYIKDFGGPLADGKFAQEDGLYLKNLMITNDQTPGVTGQVCFDKALGNNIYIDLPIFCSRAVTKGRAALEVEATLLLKEMGKRYQFNVEVDLVYIGFSRLEGFTTMGEFLKDIPVGAPILASRIFDSLFNKKAKNCFYYVQGVDRKIAGTDEPVVEVEENNEP